MVPRRRFSVEYKREAVAMLESPGVSVSQIAGGTGDWGDCPGTLAASIAPGTGAGVSRPRATA